MTQLEELDSDIRIFTLQNALLHNGKANANAVLGKVLADHAELRPMVKDVLEKINGIVADVNSKTESGIKTELEELAPELLNRKKQEKIMVLPDLPNVDKSVVMRFAPGPSGPLHIGHTRAVILNDEYVKRYKGKFIIRFEDTNPQNIEPEAYDMITQDLDWLGVKYHEIVKQSDRFDIYYKWATELLQKGHAYICTCPAETFRELKSNSQPCPDRDKPIDEYLVRWQQMLDREYKPGEASLIVKTDLDHPNPAVRDFVAFRLVEQPHPITKDKYYVYPTYNFSVAIDDHLMGMTHILRGKDHLNNTFRQKYIFKYLDWPEPEFLHYGWVSMDDVILKTTLIKDGIKSGKFKDWSDVQLGTLQALNRRGFKPEAIRKFWLDVGIKDVDITFSWQTLFSFNKDIIESESNRYFFVWDPLCLVITEVPESTGASELIGHAPLHPNDPTRGAREIKLHLEDIEELGKKGIKILVTRTDLEDVAPGTKLRLKDLCNVEITSIDQENITLARYIGNDLDILKEGARIVHWVSANDNYPTNIYHPDGRVSEGYSETTVHDALDKMVQFERFGFVKLNTSTKPIIGWFTHK